MNESFDQLDDLFQPHLFPFPMTVNVPSNLPYIGETISRIGCVATCLCNGLLIFLTLFRIQRITGVYKYLIVVFSLACVSFSCLEILARPYLHNFNGGFMYFSLNDFLGDSENSRKLTKLLIIVYSSTYAGIMCLATVQFVFRYGTLINHKLLLATFHGWSCAIWLIYTLLFSSLFGLSCHFCAYPEPYSDKYMQKEIERVYNLDISTVPRSIVVAYNPNGSVRWWNLGFLFGAMSILAFQYVLIAFCGVQMQRQMAKELKNFSVPHSKLQQQFFKALVVQITIPTVLYHLPALPVLFSPLLDIKLSIQSGFIFSIFSVYPPIDTVAFMWIVSEYKYAVKRS